MSGGRIYAPAPKTPSTPSVSPFARSRSQLAPEPARSVLDDRDEQHSTEASSPTTPRHTLSFADIPLYSREERLALDKLESSRSLGSDLDTTAGFLARRFGSVDSPQRAVSPPRAPLPFPVQAKLEVGAVDDPLEAEADRFADRVMASGAPQGASEVHGAGSTAPGAEVLPRACAACDEHDEEIRREPSERMAGTPPVPSSVGSVLASPGAPLDSGARAFMEPRFGHSFAHVRVHDGPLASESAAGVGARAYTVGAHLVFRSGTYAPTTQDGRRLLAHELAHVVQQGSAEPARIQRKADQALAWWHMRGPAVLEAKRGLNRYHEQERAAGRSGFGADWKPLAEDDYLDDRVPPVLGTFQRQRKLVHKDSRVWQETLDALRDTSPTPPIPEVPAAPGATPPPAGTPTWNGAYKPADVAALKTQLNGPVELLGGTSQGYSRWLEIKNGAPVVISGPPKGKAIAADELRLTQGGLGERLLVYRLGFTVRTDAGDERDVVAEIWWFPFDETEEKVIYYHGQRAAHGDSLGAGFVLRPITGDRLLSDQMVRELVATVAMGAGEVAATGIQRGAPARYARPPAQKQEQQQPPQARVASAETPETTAPTVGPAKVASGPEAEPGMPPGGASRAPSSGEPHPENPHAHVPQRQGNWCGGACGQMAASRLGVEIDQEALARSPHFEPEVVIDKQVVGEGGFQTAGLRDALNDVAPIPGRKWVGGEIPQDISQPEGLRTHLEGYLAATNGSVILRVRGGGHWIIVDEVLPDGRIVVRDPSEASSTVLTPKQLSDMAPTGQAVFSFPEKKAK